MPKKPDEVMRQIHAWRILTRRRPEEVPPAFWERFVAAESGASWAVWLGALLFFGGISAFVVATVQLFMNRLTNSVLLVATAAEAGGLILVQVAIWRVKRRFERELVAAEGLLCLQCGYRPEGSRESVVCPECGTSIDLENVWQRGTFCFRH